MPGPYHEVVLNLPGDKIGDIVAGLLRSTGSSAIRVESARRTAKQVFNNRLYRGLRRLVYPAVQSRLPVRTGRLKQSFRMTRRGDNCLISFVFYGQQKLVRPRRVTVRRAVIEEFARRGNAIIESALQAALDAV